MGKKRSIIIIVLFLIIATARINVQAQAQTPRVILNEIAWMGSIDSANNEWIELKNMSDGEIDLTGWKIKADDGQPEIDLVGKVGANTFYLLERTSDDCLKSIIADQIYTGALGNNGENLKLYDNNGDLIDEILCDGKWPGGDNTSKKTLARKSDLSWGTSPIIGGTPKAENNFSGEETMPDDNSTSENTETNPAKEEIRSGTILINEFYSQPKEDENEWIEIINLNNKNVDLSGWTLEDGSGSKTILEGEISSEIEKNFLVIEKLKFNLNNKGDVIILRDNSENLIDKVVYGNWENTEQNNAPAPKENESCSRVGNGANSWNNFLDFNLTDVITKGASNIIDETKNSVVGQVYLNEIYPNPKGNDTVYGQGTSTEFIEFFNPTSEDTDIKDWKIKINDKKEFVISLISSSTTVKANDHLAVYKQNTKLTLPNGEGVIKIITPNSNDVWQTVKYSKAPEGESYSITDDCDHTQIEKCEWQWNVNITPGVKNVFNYLDQTDDYFNCPTEAVIGKPISFDASDIENNGNIKYEWIFDNGSSSQGAVIEHIFTRSGKQKVILKITDNNFSKNQVCDIVVSADKKTESKIKPKYIIMINEIMPNPAGDDKDEWIELKNIGESEADIYNWQLKDSTTKTIFKVMSNTLLKPENFYLVKSAKGLSLNNTNDKIGLYDSEGELIDSVEYDDPEENVSYARGENNDFFWTSSATPGKENIIKVSNLKKNTIAETKTKTAVIEQIDFVPLEEIKNCQPGDAIKTKGAVAVLPGIFGAQYFYIVGSPGAQVYSFKKDFPKLALGDTVEVSGEISEINGEKRIKIKQAQDIKLLTHGKAPAPKALAGDEISPEIAGQLVEVKGEIVKRSGQSFYLDDGTEEITVYAKSTTGINLKDIKAGDQASVIGILSLSKNGERVLPREQSDIFLKKNDQEQKVEVIGEKTEKTEWELPSRNKTRDLVVYFGIMASMILGGAFVYKRFYS